MLAYCNLLAKKEQAKLINISTINYFSGTKGYNIDSNNINRVSFFYL